MLENSDSGEILWITGGLLFKPVSYNLFCVLFAF